MTFYENPNKPSWEWLSIFNHIPTGIKFITWKDPDSNLYVVPSHKNYIGDLKISNLISGCCCHANMFAIADSDMLNSIFTQYPSPDYTIALGEGVGIDDASTTLIVSGNLASLYFPVRMGTDRFSDEVVGALKKLRFSLSSEDAADILRDKAKLCRLGPSAKGVTAEARLAELEKRRCPRLSVSLLGNGLSDQFEEIKLNNVRFYIDVGTFTTPLPDLMGFAGEISRVLTEAHDDESKLALKTYRHFFDMSGAGNDVDNDSY